MSGQLDSRTSMWTIVTVCGAVLGAILVATWAYSNIDIVMLSSAAWAPWTFAYGLFAYVALHCLLVYAEDAWARFLFGVVMAMFGGVALAIVISFPLLMGA